MSKFGIKLVKGSTILCLIIYVGLSDESTNKYSDPNQTTKSCNSGDGTVKEPCVEEAKLTRLDGVEVGHVRTFHFDDYKTLQMTTLNMKPMIFEIPNFFTKEECNHIIKLAKKLGLQSSITQQESNTNGIHILDNNGDKILDLSEMKITIEDNFDIYLDDADIRTIYSDLGIDPNKDDLVTQKEMANAAPEELTAYLNNLVISSPTKKSRFSKQVWIFPDRHSDKLIDSFHSRLKSILDLPHILIDKYNAIQVVQYGIHGHYNAHQDSGATDQPCCHLKTDTKCKICRYLTFMVYLNEVDEGGETAFPIANNDTYNEHVFRTSGNTHLNTKCSESNLKVKPVRGKAVMWYNHFVDEETGWLGKLDNFTWHGGCPVTKGTKWIMNRWINVSPDRKTDLAGG